MIDVPKPLGLFIDLEFSYLCLGDSYQGPGSADMKIDLNV